MIRTSTGINDVFQLRHPVSQIFLREIIIKKNYLCLKAHTQHAPWGARKPVLDGGSPVKDGDSFNELRYYRKEH